MLRLSTYLRQQGVEIRAVDALSCKVGERLPRHLVSQIELDGTRVNKWRFGAPLPAIRKRFTDLTRSRWVPDLVVIQGLTTFWWEGVVEVANLARETWPAAVIAIIGVYPTLAPDHARAHLPGALLVRDLPAEVAPLPTDNALFPMMGSFAYISLAGGQRNAHEIVEEIGLKCRARVRAFAFEDHGVARTHPVLFREVLHLLSERRLRATFHAFGSISAADLVLSPELAQLLRDAGFSYLYLSDDRGLPANNAAIAEFLDQSQEAAQICTKAGFPARTDKLSASICIGRTTDTIESRTILATQLAHRVGSVIVWPYQPSARECPDVPLEAQNGKLFPLRKQAGITYSEYLDLHGLATVLNAKYRERTFDFLGSGLVSRLFQDSIARGAWDPPADVKGSLLLPFVGSKQ